MEPTTRTTTEPTAMPDKERRILDAAVRVFAARGYHRSTVAHIAAEAGVAAGTIYLYFKQKEDLLGGLLDGDLTTYLEETSAMLGNLPAGVPRLETFVRRNLEFLEARPELSRVLGIHLREADPDLRRLIGPVIRKFFDLVDDIVVSGRETGVFDFAGDDRLGRHVVFGTLDATINGWILSGQRDPLAARSHDLACMLARALGAGNGVRD